MKKLRVLSIDDSKSVQTFLRDCIGDWAESFTTAINGEEGVKLVAKDKDAFDVIFLDWEMPIKDGPTTYKELCDLGVTVPVFMLTSKNDPRDIVRMLEAGVTDYLMKPFTADIIKEKLKQCFDRS